MEDLQFYFGIGWNHILSINALDHLLFLLVLTAIYVFQEWKQVLILVTAFTIGHSITLVLSVFDIIRFDTSWVEFLIPCTIVFTGIYNLVQKKKSDSSLRLNYFLALLFGLVHGMGFANSIRFMLASNQNIGVGLLGFNVGLELGQIIVVLIILFFAYIITSVLNVNRREWIIFLSSASLALALKMALERFPLLF